MQEYCIKTSSNICSGYLVESPQWGDSTKYPKQMFYVEIRIKQGLPYILFCSLRILYNSEFILMATNLGTNAVVVTRVHCICIHFAKGDNLFKHEFTFLLSETCWKKEINWKTRFCYRSVKVLSVTRSHQWKGGLPAIILISQLLPKRFTRFI